MFTNKNGEGIDTFICAVSLYVVETSKASIKDYEPPLSIISFGIVAYGFVEQPFSKQLYIEECLSLPNPSPLITILGESQPRRALFIWLSHFSGIINGRK